MMGSHGERCQYCNCDAEMCKDIGAPKCCPRCTHASIDYRELLKKYMDHVGQEEGSWFLPSGCDWSDVAFDDDEIEELESISSELKLKRS